MCAAAVFRIDATSPTKGTMRSHLIAIAMVFLVSPALSAQPAQRVSQRLALNDEEECVAVSAPLLSRTATGRSGTTFSLGLLAQFDDSAAARPLPAVVMAAFASQRTGSDSELFGGEPRLTLRLDGGPPRTYSSRRSRAMHSRRDGREGQSAYFKIPRTDLERIARARRVTGRVASFSFAFGPEQMAALRELALYAARSPRAPVPRPDGPLQVDCLSYQSIVR
jgi:hypothetical protein